MSEQRAAAIGEMQAIRADITQIQQQSLMIQAHSIRYAAMIEDNADDVVSLSCCTDGECSYSGCRATRVSAIWEISCTKRSPPSIRSAYAAADVYHGAAYMVWSWAANTGFSASGASFCSAR